ncbi:MAG: hypothetical protein ACI83N_002071, partial [Hydrogenophaga sp.]
RALSNSTGASWPAPAASAWVTALRALVSAATGGGGVLAQATKLRAKASTLAAASVRGRRHGVATVVLLLWRMKKLR